MLLLLPDVQTKLVRIITNRLSNDLNAEISISRVSILPFSGIQLTGFLIRDQQQDTLFFADKVRAGIESFSLSKKHLYFGKLRFYSPAINLHQVDDEMNFSFLLNSFASQNNDSVKWHYSARGVQISNGAVLFSHSILDNPNSIKDKLRFTGLHLDVKRLAQTNDSVAFEVLDFSVREEIGLSIEALKTKGYVKDDRIVINNLLFTTAKSSFDFDVLEIPFSKVDTMGYDVPFRVNVNQIVLSPYELRFLLKEFPHIDGDISLSGLIYGSIDNLKGRNVTGFFGSNTRIVTNFDISGLSNFNEAFLYADIESLQTSLADLELLIPGEKSALPPSFNQLGLVTYKGNITGFVNDLVAYGAFNTRLGIVNTDIGIKIRPDNELIFAGYLRTTDFQLGRLINSEKAFKNVSLNMEVSGNRRSSTDYFVFMDGAVGAMELNEYQYKNIMVQGLLTHQKFDGSVHVNDPNGSLDFIGKVDMSGEVPHFDFAAAINNAQLDRLNIYPDLKDGVISVFIETNFKGDNLDDLVGEIVLQEGIIYTPSVSIDFDSISVRAVRNNKGKKLTLSSSFADATVTGHYSFRNFRQIVSVYMDKFLPSLVKDNPNTYAQIYNDFKFDVELKEVRQIVSLFLPDVDISDKGFLRGSFSTDNSALNVDAHVDFFKVKNFSSSDLDFKVISNDTDNATLSIRAQRAGFGKFVDLYNFSVHQKAGSDTLVTNVFWNNWDQITYSGALYSTTSFSTNKYGDRDTKIAIHPSAIILADSIWTISESQMVFHDKGLSVNGFRVENGERFITANGFLHKEVDDGIKLAFNSLDLSQVLSGSDGGNISFSGIVNGEMMLQDYFRDPLLTSNLEIDQFAFNNTYFGKFNINSSWNNDLQALNVSAVLSDNDKKPLNGFGLFYPKQQHLDFQFNVDSLKIAFLSPFIQKVIQNINGTASGRMYLKGRVTNPVLSGRVKLNDGAFNVDLLKTTYSITDSVILYPNEIRFKDMTLRDRNGRTGKFRGSIYHAGDFSKMIYNLRVETNNMLMLDTRARDNSYYYGTVYSTGNMQITGTTENINVAIQARTRPNTHFFIPLQSREVAAESDFIRFVSKDSQSQIIGAPVQIVPEYSVDLSGVNLEMDIEVTPDAQVQIIFDERIGDILRSSGDGNIQIRINRYGNIRFFGEYTIQEGDYLFSLQNLINKRFVINRGGTVKWNGDPYNAALDVTAVYKLKASLSDLTGAASATDGASSDMQRRVQIHCNLMLSDELRQPGIKFGLELPSLDESSEALMLDFISSEEELNRQVLSLLILNRFYTPDHLRMSEGASARSDNAALVTTSEMLSSQLSRWFSTISDDVDVGVAYRPGDNITSEEFELALSTQVFNNRLTINGNVGYGRYQANTSRMIGDFDMDLKLNTSGTIRARAYTRSNEVLIYETSPTTQGIGLSFKEEFDRFGELMSKYWRAIAGKRDEEYE